jgi:hypothetical protein
MADRTPASGKGLLFGEPGGCEGEPGDELTQWSLADELRTGMAQVLDRSASL